MEITSLVTFAAALALAAAIPGPGIAAVVGRALASGWRPTVPLILGLITGDLIYLSAAALGLGVIAASFGGAFALIRWLGAAYLAFLALRLWTQPVEPVAAKAQPRRIGGYLAGLAVTLGNPKVIVFYLALLPTLIDLGGLTALGFAELVAIVFVVLALVTGGYAAAAARARRLFETGSARRWLNRIAGTAMMGAAAAIAARG